MAERVAKYVADFDSLLLKYFYEPTADGAVGAKRKSGGDVKKGAKAAAAESDHLSRWLHKHQDVCLPDGPKNRLVQLLLAHVRLCKAVAAAAPVSEGDAAVFEFLREKCGGVLGVYLMLPEGKITTGKMKKQALRALEDIRGMSAGGGGGGGTAEASVELDLVDALASGGKEFVLHMMNDAGTEEVSATIADAEAFGEMQAALEEGLPVRVSLRPSTHEYVTFVVGDDAEGAPLEG